VGEGGVEGGVGGEEDEEAVGDEAGAVDQQVAELVEVPRRLAALEAAVERHPRRPLAHHRRQHLPPAEPHPILSSHPSRTPPHPSPSSPATARGAGGPGTRR
jgi:hypothetical protein